MPQYKLTYFDVTALGEPIRFLLSYGKYDWEDVRIGSDDWTKYKPLMPFGQMPILEFDGKKLHQSIAICRYLANEVGLAGSNNFENYEIDSAVDTFNDLRAKLSSFAYDEDASAKAKGKEVFLTETAPYYLERLEAVAKKNNGHLALGKTTWADLWLAGVLPYLNFHAGKDLIASYPNLKKVVEGALAIETIKKWVAKRPNNPL